MTKHAAPSAHASSSIDRAEVFQLIKRGDLNVAEVERSDRSVVELSVLWQTSILRVAHLGPEQGFSFASDGEDREDRMVLDASMMPAGLREFSVIAREGTPVFRAPIGVRVELEVDGVWRALEDGTELGAVRVAEGAMREIPLHVGMRCRMHLGGLTVSARPVPAAVRAVARRTQDRALLASGLGALTLVGSLVGFGYVSSAQSGMLVSDGQEDRLSDIIGMMNRQRERAAEEQPQPSSAQSEQPAQGAAARGESGQSGRRDVTARNRRIAVQDRGLPPQLARPQNAREQVLSRGIFLALGGPAATQAAQSGPVSPFGGLTSSGHDPRDAWGNLQGDSIGDAMGFGGLGSTGTGAGAGGNGEGTVCTGANCGFSTLGIGGSETGGHFGSTVGTRLARRGTHGPIARAATPEVQGEYSRELVRRVVLRNLSQVTHCHEQGLAQNPALEGRVVVTFVIGTDGRVMGSGVSESSLAVPSVGSCIANAVRRWQFTPPSGSSITVHYPFTLQAAQ
jgi:TonB family protein